MSRRHVFAAFLRRCWTTLMRRTPLRQLRDRAAPIGRSACPRAASPSQGDATLHLATQSLHHSVGNHLALLSAMMALQARSSESAEVQQALQVAQSRIAAVAQAMRVGAVGDEDGLINARDLVPRLVDGLSQLCSNDQVRFEVDVQDVMLTTDEAVAFMLIINELAVNSLKHAFPSSSSGVIRIRLAPAAGSPAPSIVLVVEDNGVGHQSGRPARGLGGTIIATTANHLGATYVEEAGWTQEGRRGLRSTVIKPRR